MTDPPILIYGSGAMACFLAAQLSSCGFKICLADGWVQGLQTIRESGITLKLNQKVVQQEVQTILPGETIPACRHGFVLVKSWQTAQAASAISGCLLCDGLVLTLQNGLGNDQILKQKLGDGRVAVGVTTLGATLTAPGTVTGFDKGLTTIQDGPGSQDYLSIFESAHLQMVMDASIGRLVWEKLVINAAINPLTALLGIPNGGLLDNPPALDLMEHIAAEAITVSTRLGISPASPDPMAQILAAARATAPNYSSMYQDLHRGAPTEINQINGAIVQLGLRLGIPTPYNQCMLSLVRSRVSLNVSR